MNRKVSAGGGLTWDFRTDEKLGVSDVKCLDDQFGDSCFHDRLAVIRAS
jgi:hypothetical protein